MGDYYSLLVLTLCVCVCVCSCVLLTCGVVKMVKWLYVLAVPVGIAALVLAYIQSQLQYSIFFYMPGILGRWLIPTQKYRELDWIVAAPRVSDKPNIIVIVADDLGINDLHGGAGVETPYIDSIFQNGVRFNKAYAGHATCSPSRAALLTGRYGARFGFELTAIPTIMARVVARQSSNSTHKPIFHSELLDKVPHFSEMIVPLKEKMLSTVIDETGDYNTVYIGKWHLGETVGARPQDRGYHETLAFLKGASLYLPITSPDVVTVPLGDNHDDFLINNLGAFLFFNNETRFECVEYMTDYLAKMTAKAIRAKAAAPYFITVAFNAPHTPVQAKKSDFDALSHIPDRKKRAYAAMILALDRGVGTILDAVKESGKADNTLIIFTSDNGAPYYLGLQTNNAPFRGGKYSFFEGGVRVPMFMSWPRVIQRGVTSDIPVAHVDIFSTAAAAAGVDLAKLASDRVYDGANMLTLPHVSKDSEGSAAEHTHEPHPSLFWRSGHYKALRIDDMKIHVSERPDKVWIFDLNADPTEHHNLVAGLAWSRFNQSLAAPKDKECIDLLASLSLPTVTTRDNGCDADDQTCRSVGVNSASRRAQFCGLGRMVISVNNEQVDPIWPALLEFPMGIDNKGHNIGAEDEYVYWAN
jgi:arylsulfatase A-like enzyme